MVKVLCIVQARLTSSRLPNKVLMTLGDSGLTILEHVNLRLKQSKYIDKVVFAIPDSPLNDKLASFMDEKGIEYTRGSEDDVLDRFYQCTKGYNPEIVVRATCDNPFVDWTLCDTLIEKLGEYDYVGCKDTPLGTSLEVFTMESLEKAYQFATTEPEKEHVTPYIIQKMNSTFIPFNGLSYRLTVDEERDFYVANTLYMNLYNGCPIQNTEVYDYLNSHPELAHYNQEVHQKQLGE